MSAVPQGVFAALKIKQNSEKLNETGWKRNPVPEQPPLKYNIKLMNSIWGLYNRYSVHNLKKNCDPVRYDVFNDRRFQA